MKLPKECDIYKINDYLEQLFVVAAELSQEHMHDLKVNDICERNLINLTRLSAIIVHLELAIDEVMRIK